MYDEYGGQNYVPLSINLWQNMESVVKPFARQYTFQFLRDGGAVWSVYTQNNYIPLNYVIDTAGVIVGSMVGFSEATIRSWIEPYLTGVSEKPAVNPRSVSITGTSPAAGPTTVRFNLSLADHVTLRVYSSTGTLVRTIVSGQLPAGVHHVSWDLNDDAGRAAANGLYIYELTGSSVSARAKVSVLR
jgi:hypothetical protein